MQTCLEKRSIEQRHISLARSDYNRENQYSATHPDALADGDVQGKGTGHSGHGFWLPNCNSAINVFNYSNFDTAVSSGAGNVTDNEARATSLARSMYNAENPYTSSLVNTELNVLEGQYRVP